MRPRILWLAAAIFALWVQAGAAMAGDFTNRHASSRRTATVEQVNGDHYILHDRQGRRTGTASTDALRRYVVRDRQDRRAKSPGFTLTPKGLPTHDRSLAPCGLTYVKDKAALRAYSANMEQRLAAGCSVLRWVRCCPKEAGITRKCVSMMGS